MGVQISYDIVGAGWAKAWDMSCHLSDASTPKVNTTL